MSLAIVESPPRSTESDAAAQRTASGVPAPELTILMPCLNEAETLETCIRKARGFLDRYSVAGEIVIGDNGSTDGSQEIARRAGARVVAVPVRGYGAALYHATLEAHGKYIIMGDSDDSYDFTALQPFLDKLREGYDLVMGNRFAGGIQPGAMPWKNRWLGNPVLTGIGRLFFRCSLRDFHCGLRGYSRAAFERMQLCTTGMEFASEMVIKATLLEMNVTEVPTTLRPDGRSRPPHLRPWRDGWRHLRFLLLYSPRWLFLYPGLLLIVLGLLGSAWLSFAPLVVGGVVLDVNTLLYCAVFVLLGFQAVWFALLSKLYALTQGLHPPDPFYEPLFKTASLEVGLIAGGALLLLGLAGSVGAMCTWQRHAFGPLEPSTTLRLVIPSALSLALGCQMIFSSFFLSLLGLPKQP
jgi:glycosyltransferase involved in cell wall biosynthesis